MRVDADLQRSAPDESGADGRIVSESIRIPVARGTIQGDLVLPSNARGCLIFAHGSGSSRRSPRNRYVARVLQDAGLATLLMDLLSGPEELEEQAGAMRRFDIDLLAGRLSLATEWTQTRPATENLPIGYFGASTGAAAALIAAAARSDQVRAIVSRGGRPDLASPSVLRRIEAPTLLLVGSADREVLELNRRALAHMRGDHALRIVPGATHLFEEPGALEQVAEQAREWFLRHLPELHRRQGAVTFSSVF